MALSRKKSNFKTGMFLLENITSGMYNDPLAILREYIQNSVDSIDLAHQEPGSSSPEISIDLDPLAKRIVIRDNGQGIPAEDAEEVLCSIGSSNKAGKGLRGFRGIGRLGGIAFSDKAVFRTKADGETVESVQEWDCKKLHRIVGEQGNNKLSLAQVLNRVTDFSHENSKKKNGSYFEVTLEGVSSFRNYLFDITRVERFLSQVAPVPFDPVMFKFSKEVETYLKERLSHYRRYNILLNGEPVYKPYKDWVRVTKGGMDKLEGIEAFEVTGPQDEVLGIGWFGSRRELLGSIAKGDDSSGIRVRAGNIMIGDSHLLDGCFREARFNGYLSGEIHIEFQDLIPNSRRDDFVDNKHKNFFYNGVERELGLPISKEIRYRSRVQSKLREPSPAVKKQPSISSKNKDATTAKAIPIKTSPVTIDKPQQGDLLSKLLSHCQGCPNLRLILGDLVNE